MEKRLLVAIFLSMLLVVAYNLLVPPQRPVRRTLGPEQPVAVGKEAVSATPSARPHEPGATVTQALPSGPEPQLTVPLAPVRVETDLVSAVLSNRGGVIRSLELKNYPDNKGKPVDLIIPGEEVYFPLHLSFGNPVLDAMVNNSTYEVNVASLELNAANPTAEVRFALSTPEGLRVTKKLTFHTALYGIDVEVAVAGLPADAPPGLYRIFWGDQLSGGDVTQNKRFSYDRIVTLLGNKRIEQKPEKVAMEERYQERLHWTAISSKYFLAAFIPREPTTAAIIQRSAKNRATVGLEFVEEQGPTPHSFTLYAGPKKAEALKPYNVSLERAINFGWFNVVAVPLLKALVFFHSFTHNYGVAIILLTVIVKVLFYPLTGKSLASMKQMQEIQPKMKLIQERWKNDRQKMNEEMMALYREHKVNPLGGCLPLLLQMPVFFALYKVLYDAIELRHAPGILWINDLSNRDIPLTILMGASMYFQQKLSPSMGDPRQAKMMLYFMPAIFTIMFVNFPSGLVLYWLVNNLLSIAQQYMMMRPGPEPQPARVQQARDATRARS